MRKEKYMTTFQEPRTRTFTWHDPVPALQAAQTMSGLAYLKALMAGELPPPPVIDLVGINMTEAGEGRVVLTIEPAEYHYNIMGMVHGGISATLLDTGMGLSVLSLLPAGHRFTTLEIKVNYLRPITERTGIVTCEGTIIHRGARIATSEARITDARGKLYAHSTTTCMIFPRE
jgi:uncharacterized protein (TIGR00369 family)